jgi:hypothetical protein
MPEYVNTKTGDRRVTVRNSHMDKRVRADTDWELHDPDVGTTDDSTADPEPKPVETAPKPTKNDKPNGDPAD